MTSPVARFDARVDAAFERLRGRPLVDTTFRIASDVGDFSVVWHAVNVARGVARRRPDQVAVLATGLAAESLLVNQGVKRLVGRARPTDAGDPRTPVRRPRTSSFPSGHASAAAFNATVLSSWDRDCGRGSIGWPVAWWSLAAVVATSRVHVRIHHASDVVAGAAVGIALGLVTTRVAARFGIGPGMRRHR